MRRSQPDNTISAETDDGNLEDESSIRRFPRVGAQFQTRISKSTGFTIRPAPERMSVDFPYISEKEAEGLDKVRTNGSVEPKNGISSTDSGFELRSNCSKSYRGGVLIHKPAKEIEEFSEYVQPFIVSTRKQATPTISNEAWVQHMIHLHTTEATGKRNRACRGGVKRKRPENEEMIWNLENILNDLQKNRSSTPVTDMLGEEKAAALDHLWLCFGGNIESAKFNALVNLSGGQASKMRKCEERERTKRKLKVPSQQTSESWREMYESSTLPYVRTILGQLQDDSEPRYLMQIMSAQTLAGRSDEQAKVNLVLEPDDLKGAWRSILACAKSIERQLNSEGTGPGDKKPLLSTLLTFVGKAYALPTPESCFGTHHVMIEEVSNTIISILNHVKKAQNVHAKIRDKLFNESECGINSDELLKFLDTEYNGLPIRLREVDKLYSFRDVVVKWESRLEQALFATEEELEYTNSKNYLNIAEKMQYEARSHGYRSKALVQLSNRINKAYDLRGRILRWKSAGMHGKVTTVRTISGFVKEAKRIKLFSPEVLEIFEYHRAAEEWIDRANIAIRSKISLNELKTLIERGEEMTLDLSEYIDKLKTRERIADDWLEALDGIVPFLKNGSTPSEIWYNLETSLRNGNHNRLHDLSSEGNRIPVDVVAVKLLQLALDAKSWTTKALKWIPDNADSKKGKLCDLREHLDKVSSLREKLPLPETERQAWKPPGECELTAIVDTADSWAEKYKNFLAGDNRKSERRSCLSISKLRTIVEEGNAIYANMGNSTSKISRILLQAENWYEAHLPLLQHCGIASKGTAVEIPSKTYITIQDMSVAVEAARTDVSLDLDEALELREVLNQSSSWKERVALIAPKRNKRYSRGSKSKFKLKDLIGLIEEASNLPIDTAESVNRLQIQLNDVETWRSVASKALEGILLEFTGLKSHVDDVYGKAKDYSIESLSDTFDSDDESVNGQPDTSRVKSNTDAEHDEEQMDDVEDEPMMESMISTEEVPTSQKGSSSALTVFRLIKELNDEAKDISVITVEGELGELLDNVSKWCVKSFKYLNTPREVFDKRYFGAFDRFFVEGEDLCNVSCGNQLDCTSGGLGERLFGAWGGILKDQLLRLSILKRERGKFEAWCTRASQIISDEKTLTATKLADLAKSSRHFPANRDLVSRIRGLSVKVSKWTAKAHKLFESGDSIDMQDARILLETGEKLKVQMEELKRLRAEIRAARNWSNRAKECNVEHGSINVDDVKQLIHEHDRLLIEMPDELECLKQATIGYCICRRPYEGFMIGCDHCEEWYHGSCIGISESKADRFEKFVCVRCSMKNILQSSAVTAAGIIRKWTCPKDLKKARQIEFQKFQRKDRKEKKDIEKLSKQMKDLLDQLSELKRSDKVTEDTGTVMDIEQTTLSDTTTGSTPAESRNDDHAVKVGDPSASILPVQNEEASKEMNDKNIGSHEAPTANASLNKDDTTIYTHQTESTKEDGSSSLMNVSKTENTNAVPCVLLSEAEIMQKLEKVKASLQLSKDRLEKISNQSHHRTLKEAEEDKYAKVLRHWCLKVRSEILLPSVQSQSETSKPSACGSLSPVMKQFIVEAEQLRIIDLSDVKKIVICFQSICWSFSAMGVLRRKPSLSQVRNLVSDASKFKFPDEKALRTVKFMANKASQLQSKVEKALFTKKSTSKPNLSLLKDLQSGIRESPVIIPDEDILRLVIEDGKLSSREILENRSKELKRGQSKPQNMTEDVSPHAPNPSDLWPPFGLRHSEAAVQAFGSECLAIPAPNHPIQDMDPQINEIVSGPPSLSQERRQDPTELHLRETQGLEASTTLNNVSAQCAPHCLNGFHQEEKLKVERSLPNLELEAPDPRQEAVSDAKRGEHGADCSGTAAFPNGLPNVKPEVKQKHDTTILDIQPVTTNTICESQLESDSKDDTVPVNPSIPAHESSKESGSQTKDHPAVETSTVRPSLPSATSNCTSNSNIDTSDGTKAINLETPMETSNGICSLVKAEPLSREVLPAALSASQLESRAKNGSETKPTRADDTPIAPHSPSHGHPIGDTKDASSAPAINLISCALKQDACHEGENMDQSDGAAAP